MNRCKYKTEIVNACPFGLEICCAECIDAPERQNGCGCEDEDKGDMCEYAMEE